MEQHYGILVWVALTTLWRWGWSPGICDASFTLAILEEMLGPLCTEPMEMLNMGMRVMSGMLSWYRKWELEYGDRDNKWLLCKFSANKLLLGLLAHSVYPDRCRHECEPSCKLEVHSKEAWHFEKSYVQIVLRCTLSICAKYVEAIEEVVAAIIFCSWSYMHTGTATPWWACMHLTFLNSELHLYSSAWLPTYCSPDSCH